MGKWNRVSGSDTLLPDTLFKNCVNKALLETPALLIDLDVLERNSARMMQFFRGAPVSLRPHTKTHRTPALAKLQLAAGAQGICCGNLGEAQVMIAAGIEDVLVTKEIVQPQQIARVAELARDSEIIVVVDNAENVAQFGRAAQAVGTEIRMLVDVDVRLERTGVAPGESALKLARTIAATDGLRFMGLMGYEGSMHALSLEERERVCRESLAELIATRELIERDGITVEMVSVGASSTYKTAARIPGVTEVQAGSYLTGDARYMAEWSDFEPAVTVLTTVTSRPGARAATMDAGQKKLSSDAGLPIVKNLDGVTLTALNEEHGILRLSEDAKPLRVGDKVEIIPSHGGTTINLFDVMYAMRGDNVEAVFEIAGRGK